MRGSRVTFFAVGVLVAGLLVASPEAVRADDAARVAITGLRGPASVVRDIDGISHVRAANAHDLFFLQGYVHAEDRMFQMDVNRRRPSGTLAELIGAGAIPSDVQMRTLGLRRAAERNLPVLTSETQQALKAYAEGVNAWLARNPLPSQYAAVQVTKVAPWTETDSILVLKVVGFALSFDLDIDRTSAVAAYSAAGLDGHTAVTQDLFPFAPFNDASPVNDATGRPFTPGGVRAAPPVGGKGVSEAAAEMAAGYLKKAEEAPLIAQALNRERDVGSNAWVISGRHTSTGRPMMASDPHLPQESPAIWYPIELDGGGYHVAGDSLPGTPFVVLGQNEHMVYSATTHNMDVTDTYVEKLVSDPASPSGLSTVYMGRNEPVVAIPETFRVNPRTPGQTDRLTIVPAGGAIPEKTLIVPRRNNGPLLSADLSKNMALSVQYTGWKPTAEMDAFRLFNLARDLDDFRRALQYFDLGAQHWLYADLKGTIAYFTVAEVPIREDLQAGAVRGNPPYLLRNGQGGNEWLQVRNPQPQQLVPYEIIPFDEFPQTVNPPAGFVVTANNDGFGTTLDNNVLNLSRPGGGIYYPSHTHNGYRAGRITDLLRAAVAKGRITQADVIDIQADVTGIDAQFFTPIITSALDRARRSSTPQLAALANDTRVVEAVGRMSRWNHSYPTGIPEGYDSSDRDGKLSRPTQNEINSSVAGTIFTLWRGKFVINVLDKHVRAISANLPLPDGHDAVKALRQLMVDFDTREGVGRSGIDFFAVPGIAGAADRRDFLVLSSLAEALTLAAGDNFTAAFGNSTNQNDYRWGKLHRYQFTSVIGAPYAVPSAGNPFTSPLPGLPGIPVDGGFQVPDVYNFDVRADSPDKFAGVFPVPSRRFVAQGTVSGWRTVDSLAGGISEEPGSDRQNLFKRYLTNDTYALRMYSDDLREATDSVTLYLPVRRT